MQTVVLVGAESFQLKGMVVFIWGASAKSVDSSAAPAGIEVLDRIPMDTIRPRRNVVEIGIADQRRKSLL